MSRQYTKISANKKAPVKRLVRPAAKMSTLLKSGKSFRAMGK